MSKIRSKIILDMIYPVGSIYLSTNNVNPSNFVGGTWASWGAGKVPVGVDTTQPEFNTVEKVGGEKTHKLTITEMPKHSHRQKAHNWETISASNTGIRANEGDYGDDTSETGGDQPHNNLQPYITCYMWKRIA